ncbi:hypothetical protein JQ582_40830 [Bradyrhizobium japonicum]|uniref:hypothetical protein n=1 Tax=Bradyrhizobium japonicum TaxID=375 RepID=UPI001BA80454|nr:hypothetical protein [Bradyrhizobium japonicum]MBR0750265.1 hypothetical protein [Bradyrhizobium japonicum]
MQQSEQADPRAAFILTNASRLIIVATRCVWSFGAAEGLNDILTSRPDQHGEWRQPVSVLHRDVLLMAALRVSILLDADPTAVSFQTVYHALKEPVVQAAILQMLEDQRGFDVFSPTRADLIGTYLMTYREIDWKVHGRLVHLRNLGIAHLTLDQLKKSITLAEFRTMVEVVTRLASTMQHLFQTDTAFHGDMVEECRDQVKRAIDCGPK